MVQSLQKLIEIGGSALCSEDPVADIAGFGLARQASESIDRIAVTEE
jgi:hypothetical protein